MPFRYLVADPPRLLRDQVTGSTRGPARATRHAVHRGDRALLLSPLADQAVLFLQGLASMQQAAFDVLRTAHRRRVPLRLRRRPEPREELRGELVQLVGERVAGCAGGERGTIRRHEAQRDHRDRVRCRLRHRRRCRAVGRSACPRGDCSDAVGVPVRAGRRLREHRGHADLEQARRRRLGAREHHADAVPPGDDGLHQARAALTYALTSGG